MLSDEVIEKVVERLVRRIEQGNEYIIETIGKSVKEIGTLTPSKAQQLVQIMRYGGDYDKIVKKLAEITKLNKKDIYKIFREVAKSDYQFAEQFYNYRKIKYIPFDENIQLQQQINVLAELTAHEYTDLTKSSMLGYGFQDEKGRVVFKGLKQTYDDVIEEAIINAGQGKETFDSALYRTLKELGNSGLQVIYPTTYQTTDKDGNIITKHRTMRLESAIRTQMLSAIRNEHIEVQKEVGKKFKSDGWEITVHFNPAPDHELVQGRQFSNEEFEKFQNDENAVSYDGIEFPAISEETGHDRRAIAQYNCYHNAVAIVLGVNKPQYSNEKLQEIIDNSHKKFKFGKKEYTMYEGQQLQRKLELEIRKAKDQQILGVSTDNKKLILKSQERITQLNDKYKQLSKISGLAEKKERMRVIGYKRVAKNKLV